MIIGTANVATTAIFAVLAPVRWPMAAAIAVDSLLGGAVGTQLVRRVPAPHLRVGIAVVGLAVAVRLALSPRASATMPAPIAAVASRRRRR